MSGLLAGVGEGLRLLFSGDPEVWGIAGLSLRVSLAATACALALGVPLGALLAHRRHGRLAAAPSPARTAALGAVNAGMGLPPVVAGLIVSMLLWRSGPLGGLRLLYTPAAMVVAQAVIATPIVAGLTAAALNGLDPSYRLQLRSLGAGPLRETWLLLREARVGMLAAVVAGFGAVISEVGAAMMVGGNIRGQTRVLTTATVLEVNRGNFETAVALSAVLLALVYGVVLLLTIVQGRR
ncbi:MAG: ABC transporter permease [Chloroflexota bacterium]